MDNCITMYKLKFNFDLCLMSRNLENLENCTLLILSGLWLVLLYVYGFTSIKEVWGDDET